jgi:periplasmic protein TonB
MISKKTVKADLTSKSFLFFNVGLITALSLVIFAFTFKTEDDTVVHDLASGNGQVEELMEVPLTEQLPPAAPKVQQPQFVEVLNTHKVEEISFDLDPEIIEPETNAVAVAVEIEEEDPNTLFTIVEESASPVGGMSPFYEFIARNVKYPAQARRLSIEGRVFVEFVVEKDGTLTNIKTLKGIGAGCDEEAVRVLGLAPKWIPGKQRGRPARQKMVLPIIFKTDY